MRLPSRYVEGNLNFVLDTCFNCTWKSRARLTPEGKATVTPENFFVLTPVKS